MKLKFIASIALICATTTACAQTQEQTTGALIGGALGAWLGNGGGHQKEAAVGGAAVGYILGNSMLNNRTPGYDSRYSTIPNSRYRGTYNDFRNYCNSQVPYEYRGNIGAATSWSNGCVNRLQQEQQMLEQEAYRNGAYPR